MSRAVADAVAQGCDLVTLQVAEGSAAERLYLALGFRAAFTADVHARQQPWFARASIA
jgi:hypothetical protein